MGLVVDNLSVRYGAIRAVTSVSLRVDEGELVALIGPNGAGKSSTLNAIAGVVAPSGGTIHLRDSRIDGLSAEDITRRGLSLIPEGRRIFQTLTVAENLRIGGITASERRTDRERQAYVLQLFPVLEDRLDQPAGQLSGGQQQMLAVARSLMSDPEVLLLDEPSLGLAPRLVSEIFAMIGRLRAGGTTLLLVEQNARQALRVADRAYVMSSGTAVEVDRSEAANSQELAEAYNLGSVRGKAGTGP